MWMKGEETNKNADNRQEIKAKRRLHQEPPFCHLTKNLFNIEFVGHQGLYALHAAHAAQVFVIRVSSPEFVAE